MRTTLLRFTPPPDPPGHSRSAGIHLSQCVKSIMQRLDPKRFGQDNLSDPELRAFFELGFTWEVALEHAWGRRERRLRRRHLKLQQEFCMDRIFMTPDGCDYLRRRLEEYKFTWMSSNSHVTDPRFFHWLLQIKGYLWYLVKMEGFRPVCMLYVCHVNGDYRVKRVKPLRWKLRFTVAELKQNWRVLCAERDRLERKQMKKKGRAA